MGFHTGSVSFRRFALPSVLPSVPDEAVLDSLRAKSIPADQPVQEVETGWSGGRHMFDRTITFDKNVYGESILFGLQVVTNKIPSAVKKAHATVLIDAAGAGNPSGFASKLQKRQAKEQAASIVEQERNEGKYRKVKDVPVAWDLKNHALYVSGSGAAIAHVDGLFVETFDLVEGVSVDSAGLLASRYALKQDLDVQLDDATPTQFGLDPAEITQYPWASKTEHEKDFLGNEFLVWLWFTVDHVTSTIPVNGKDVVLMFDRTLVAECGVGEHGRDSFSGTMPTKLPEAMEALRHGKLPRKAGLVADVDGVAFSFVFDPEKFAFNGVKFPDVQGEDTRSIVEARVALIDSLYAAIVGLFNQFLAIRLDAEKWAAAVVGINNWISDEEPAVAAAE